MLLDRLWLLAAVKYPSLPPVETTVDTHVPPAVSHRQHSVAEALQSRGWKAPAY